MKSWRKLEKQEQWGIPKGERCTGNRSVASQCRTRRAGAKAVLQASQDGDAKQRQLSPLACCEAAGK